METYDGSFYSSGLQTTSETQPLYSILNPEQIYPDKDYSYVDDSQVMLLNTANVEYHSHMNAHHPHANCFSPTFYHYAETDASMGDPQQSISDVFHDGDAVIEPSSASQLRRHHKYSSNMLNSSMHNDQSRKASETHRLPSIKEVPIIPPAINPHYNEVSMEETQEIIHNIDQLIDH